MHNEEVFTPSDVAMDLINCLVYSSIIQSRPDRTIGKKHIMDNSCGCGMLLGVVVQYYIQEARMKRRTDDEIVKELETYIHGIEINTELHAKAKQTLDAYALLGFGTPKNINWDIRCDDALLCHDYDGQMDIVIGNPPYCRVHDFKDKYEVYKSCQFMEVGMTDLYLAFFGVGLRMLKDKGELVYITPQSYLWSVAGRNFRKYLVDQKWKLSIIDQGHRQRFSGVTTFTAITHISKGTPSESYIHRLDKPDKTFDMYAIKYEDALVNDRLWALDEEQRGVLREIFRNETESTVIVRNGFATLKDKLFLNTVELSEHNIPVVKAGKLKEQQMFFPYDMVTGRPLEWEELEQSVQEGLLKNAVELDVDTTKEHWFHYGRYQAIKDVSKAKVVFSPYLKYDVPFKAKAVDEGVGVYSGLYVVCEKDVQDKVVEILMSDDFKKFVISLGKTKSGGYYTMSSKEIEIYINYMLTKINDNKDAID